MNKNAPSPKPKLNLVSRRRRFGIFTGCGLVVLAGIILFRPQNENLRVGGPLIRGHEVLKCNACHGEGEGTSRQQIQANVRYFLGLRTEKVEFGHAAVTNESCLKCHDRTNERHPVYRFNEPRYLKVRKILKPQECSSCHKEHQGNFLTLPNMGFCMHCHQTLAVKNDKIIPPHKSLIGSKQWTTCLRCHDFHGNHNLKLPQDLKFAFKQKLLNNYFSGKTKSPYGAKLFKAPEKVPDEN